MFFVEIYKLKDDGVQEIFVVCKLTGETATCEGDPAFVLSLEKEGISDYSSCARAQLYPKDGMRFLKQLQFNFTSGYLNASDVKRG
jgi:hypothetical protein